MTGGDPISAGLGISEVDLYCAMLALLFTGLVALVGWAFWPEKKR